MNGRQHDTPNYYMPYESGEDTDASEYNKDDDYDSESLPSYEDPRIRREQDPRYAIIAAAGPNFNTSAQQLKYMEHAPGAEYLPSNNISSLANLVYLDPPKTTQTSLFSIKSTNRDSSVYPSPFNFQIKTPRVYKNVTKFQLVQLSFPNNTQTIANASVLQSTIIDYLISLGFSLSCATSCINVVVNSGTAFDSIGIVEQGIGAQPTIKKLQIPGGLYTNDQLADELTFQANNTPPFHTIPYDYFNAAFKANADVSILFNEPGDNFQTLATSGQRFGRGSSGGCTKDTIINTYFNQNFLNVYPVVTDTIAFNVYYYPVMKELLASPLGKYFVTYEGFSMDDIVNYIYSGFQGFDNDVLYNILSTNRGVLDEFRKNLTFERRNVNAHKWTYNSNLNQFTCITPSLHISLKKDIQSKLSTFLNQEISIAAFTPATFQTFKNTNSNNNSILAHLVSNLSSIFGDYFPGETNFTYTDGIYSTMIGGTGVTRSASDLLGDSAFSTLFINYRSTFGRQFGTSVGSTFTFSNFHDYDTTLSSFYGLVQAGTSTISTIYGLTYQNHSQYVSTFYSAVLPQSMINSATYLNGQAVPTSLIGNKFIYTPGFSVNDSVSDLSTCVAECRALIQQTIYNYYSCLPVNSIINTLSYRLGLNNFTAFNIVSTTLAIASTNNFDFLMQINTDQSFNNMDVGMNENMSISNETTGQVKLVSAKVLMAGVGAGEESQTCIQNPVLFTNTLGKLDKLEFKLYADDDTITPLWLYFPFEFGFNEWNATFQIEEEIAFANRNTGWGNRPTVPIPNNPDNMIFLALTSTNNPNNK